MSILNTLDKYMDIQTYVWKSCLFYLPSPVILCNCWVLMRVVRMNWGLLRTPIATMGWITRVGRIVKIAAKITVDITTITKKCLHLVSVGFESFALLNIFEIRMYHEKILNRQWFLISIFQEPANRKQFSIMAIKISRPFLALSRST